MVNTTASFGSTIKIPLQIKIIVMNEIGGIKARYGLKTEATIPPANRNKITKLKIQHFSPDEAIRIFSLGARSESGAGLTCPTLTEL
jgi:hypothetical protein